MSVNKVILVGRLGQDPELKSTPSGMSVCNFSIATSENWVDRSGQKQERTEWHRIVVWGKLAENCGQYLKKGRQVYVEGYLQTRSWEDKDGQKRYTTEVVARIVQFLGDASLKDSNKTVENNTGGIMESNYDISSNTNFTSDDIPF